MSWEQPNDPSSDSLAGFGFERFGECASTDDFSERGHVSLESGPAGRGELCTQTSTALTQDLIERQVPRLLERRELLGEGGVRQLELVSDECELDPVRGSDERYT